MEKYLAFILWGLCLVILYKIWRDYTQKKSELISIRSLFLVGSLIFLPSSAALTLYNGDSGIFHIKDPASSGLIFTIWIIIFYVVFELTYWKLPLSPWVASLIPKPEKTISDLVLCVVTFAFLFSSGVLRLIPLGEFSNQILIPLSSACKITAACIGAWVLVGRWRNPIYLVFGVLVVGWIALDFAFGSFSRRPILSVGLALIWVAYYRVLRLQSPRFVALKVLPLCAIALVGLFFVTGARDARFRGQDAEERRANVDFVSNVQEGFTKVIGGQGTGAAGMWAIEQWPDIEETRPLMSLRYFSLFPVPRSIWKGKPIELALLVPFYVNHPNAGGGLNMPPGIVGYAAAEGGLFAMIVYAIWFGIMLRLYDQYIVTNVLSVVAIVPFGIALGHIVGLPRGGLALFAFLYIQETVFVFVTLFLVMKFFGSTPLAENQAPPTPAR